MTAERDPYAILGVPVDASTEAVAGAYRSLARLHHPDVSRASGAEHRMAEINAAWTVLRDPARRAAWDRAHGIAPTWSKPAAGTTGADHAAGTSHATHGATRAAGRGRTTGWRRGPAGEGAAGPPPGNPRGSVLPFGRHIGWSLGEIARVDPGYLVWLEARREGEPYRAEIDTLLEAMRARAADAVPRRRRRGPFG